MVTDFSLFTSNTGVRTQGPGVNTATSVGRQVTFGVEFYVTRKVWLKTAVLWRNDYRATGTPTFQLYVVNNNASGTPVAGGAGSMPTGNYGGWGYGRTNPLQLNPGVAYKMAITLPNYYHLSRDYFGPYDPYPNGIGNNGVIYAPGAAQSVSGKQMSYVYGTGYPNTDNYDFNGWIDVTVTDVDPAAVLTLGAIGSKGKTGNIPISLTASGFARKRTVKASALSLHLSAVGFYQFSSTLTSKAAIDFSADAIDVFHHSNLILSEAVLPLSTQAESHKSSPLIGTTAVELRMPPLSEFFKMTAAAIKSSLLSEHWSAENRRFKQAADLDAESLTATTVGGMFLNAIGDYPRGHDNIRHLRSFRVKNQDVYATNFEGPRQVMGYKPYAELGEDAYANPPVVIDQAGTWAAVMMKMNYGEPVGDDVDSMRRWADTRIIRDADKSLYGAQFLSYSRNATESGFSIVARPSLAAASWAYLAATNMRGVLGIDAPAVPHPHAIILQATPLPAEGRYKLAVSWQLTEGETATYYEATVESRNATGAWVPMFPTTTTGPLPSIQNGDRFVAQWKIPAPVTPGSFRVRVRLRNADDGPWGTSYSQAIPADSLALRQFLGEDELTQGMSGGAAWKRTSLWRWLSAES